MMNQIVLGLLLGLLMWAVALGGQSRSIWVYEACFTNGCIGDRLNSLSEERAAEAKLTTWNNATYVWYRR